MIHLLLVGSALVPSLLLMAYFHTRDLFPEPPRILWRTFGLGIVIVLPVILVAWPLSLFAELLDGPLLHGLALAFLGAAIPEEFFKLLVVWLYAARRPEFDEPIDGVVYGVAASLGFASLENVLYVTGGGLGVAVMRAVTAVPSHAFLGAILGIYVARAKFAPEAERGRWLRRAFFVPMLLHGLYDFPLMAAERAGTQLSPVPGLFVALLAVPLLIVVAEWMWAVRATRNLRSAQLPLLDPAARPTALPGRASSVFLAAGGAVVAGLGGLMTLGLLVAILFGEPAPGEATEMAGALGLLGAAPLAGGGAVFAWGLWRLNERRNGARKDVRER